jgi:putative toxin-antitoxin system antitoxin component (TIGR02293 family)
MPFNEVSEGHSTLLSQAIAVFDADEEAAKQWLRSPQIGLGNAVPLDLARTTFGYREVEKLLTRIDHGVYA